MTSGSTGAAGPCARDFGWHFRRAAVASSAAAHVHHNTQPVPYRLPACPELDCIRDRMPLGLIAAAELRAAETGVGGDRALIAADVISEEAYLAALTAVTGIRFEPLDDLPRDACPLPDEKLLDAAAVGILPLRDADQFHFVVAPRSLAARRLTEAARNDSDLAARISVTTADRMQQFIARHAAQAISQRASFALRTAHPEFSAGRGARRTPAAIALLATLALAAMMAMTAASKTFAIVDCALGGIFLSWAALRILGPLTTRDPSHPRHELGDDRLPIYTIIVALYREAAAVKDLVAALRCLDYRTTQRKSST